MPVRPGRLNTPSPVQSDYSFYHEEEEPTCYSLNSCLDCSFLNDTELMSHVFGNVNFDFSLPSIDSLLETTTTEVKKNCMWSEGANAILSTFQSSSNTMATSSSAATTAAATTTSDAATTTTAYPRRPLQSFSSTLLDANCGGFSGYSNVLSEYSNYMVFTGGSSSSSSNGSSSSLMSTRNTNDRLRLSISSTTSTGSLSDPFSYCRRLHRESLSALNYFDNDFSENDNNNFVIWTDNSSENSSLKDPDHSEGTLPTSSSCSPNSCDSYKVISKNQTSDNEFKISEDHTYFSKKDESESVLSSETSGAATTTATLSAADAARATELPLLSSSQNVTDPIFFDILDYQEGQHNNILPKAIESPQSAQNITMKLLMCDSFDQSDHTRNDYICTSSPQLSKEPSLFYNTAENGSQNYTEHDYESFQISNCEPTASMDFDSCNIISSEPDGVAKETFDTRNSNSFDNYVNDSSLFLETQNAINSLLNEEGFTQNQYEVNKRKRPHILNDQFKRMKHNEAEKKRRLLANQFYEKLRHINPTVISNSNSRITKDTIILKTITYIQYLEQTANSMREHDCYRSTGCAKSTSPTLDIIANREHFQTREEYVRNIVKETGDLLMGPHRQLGNNKFCHDDDPKRNKHNQAEKRRRLTNKTLFDFLQEINPNIATKPKVTKEKIMRYTIDYVEELKMQNNILKQSLHCNCYSSV